MDSSEQESVVILGLGRTFGAEHRIRNQVRALSGRYQIYGYGSAGLDPVTQFTIVAMPPKFLCRGVKLLGALFPRMRLFLERRFLHALGQEVKAENPRFLLAHGILDGLIALESGVPYVFDSNEYLPRQFDGMLLWRLTEIRYRRIALKRIFRQASLITVEGDRVADAYATEFSLPREKLHVVANMPTFRKTFESIQARSTKIRLIHHGILAPQRRLELLIETTRQLGSEYELTLMGAGPNEYTARLRALAAQAGNITIAEPVPYAQIVEALHGYDLGLVFFGSPHFHHKFMTVPNKFWECLQARVPVVVSPDSAMAHYVRKHDCGVVADVHSIEGFVQAIRNLNAARIQEMKSKLEEMAFLHSSDSWIGQYADVVTRHCRPRETSPRAASSEHDHG
jgi:glycosyltransferase involved in cell wall biosynthesis